jgi:hypothetical protein
MDEVTVHVNVPTSGIFTLYCGAESPNSKRFVTVVSATTMATCPACLDAFACAILDRMMAIDSRIPRQSIGDLARAFLDMEKNRVDVVAKNV